MEESIPQGSDATKKPAWSPYLVSISRTLVEQEIKLLPRTLSLIGSVESAGCGR